MVLPTGTSRRLIVKPNVGELWNISDEVKVSVGNNIATFLISGPGLVVGIHRNHDSFGDYYKVIWGGRTEEFLLSNFGEKIQGF
jgi:hypothetical protein